jgi:hypothetical protein
MAPVLTLHGTALQVVEGSLACIKRELQTKLTTTTFGATVSVRNDGSNPWLAKAGKITPTKDSWPSLASSAMGWSLADMLNPHKLKAQVIARPHHHLVIRQQLVSSIYMQS